MEAAKQNADTLGIGNDEEAVAPEGCLLALLHCTGLRCAERQMGWCLSGATLYRAAVRDMAFIVTKGNGLGRQWCICFPHRRFLSVF